MKCKKESEEKLKKILNLWIICDILQTILKNAYKKYTEIGKKKNEQKRKKKEMLKSKGFSLKTLTHYWETGRWKDEK